MKLFRKAHCPGETLNQFWIFFLLKMWVVFKYRKENTMACGDIFHEKDAALRAFGFQIPPPTGVASSVVEDDTWLVVRVKLNDKNNAQPSLCVSVEAPCQLGNYPEPG